MDFAKFLNKAIEYLFYSLLFFVPLVFIGTTSELFEFNKMWLTFGITIAIAFCWFSKMILQRRIIFKRTILDIPILLFLISQIISTVISIDHHVSLWGYYSRWNGGFLSIASYIFLYYAFVSNVLNKQNGLAIVKKSLLVSLASGLAVIIWALPSHFGYDPTCLVFRGTFDVSCWTADFQPKIRIFGPLGQPDWLAGYLGVLIPIALAFTLDTLNKSKKLLNPKIIFYSSSFLLFYLSLLYTSSRSGIASTIISLIFFGIFYVYLNRKNLEIFKNKFIYALIGVVLLISFIVGVQAPIINKFSFSEMQKLLTKPAPLAPRTNTNQGQTQTITPTAEIGGSDSLRIRRIVWRGAIDVWRANPIFGTGVETFAFAYYKFRPVEHNKLSEWNFLYNKAHNEYLNYLATTGAFGLLTYLSFISLVFLVGGVNTLNLKTKFLQFAQSQTVDHKDPLILSLFASLISILIINFFGFSVVILNIYLFLIPAFILIFYDLIKETKSPDKLKYRYTSYVQWSGITGLGFIAGALIYVLIIFWIADTKYASGYNYGHAGALQTAYPLLHEAVKMRSEPVFLDELSANDASISLGLFAQGSSQSAKVIQALAQESLTVNTQLVTDYPNNTVFWKSRVKILSNLAKIDGKFYPVALDAAKKAQILAPTDASLLYSLGVLYSQNNDTKTATQIMEKVVSYKPDFMDAHYALGLFYRDLSMDKNKRILDPIYHQKAIDEMNYILDNLDPKNKQVQESRDLMLKER